MILFSYLPLMALACTILLCSNLAAASDEALPFPEIIRVENNENELEANILLLLQHIGPNSDVLLYNIQNDAYYHIFESSENGDEVQLHDGSKWSVHPSQSNITNNWRRTDDIFIKPKSSSFASCHYVLFNRTAQDTVEVNLISPPIQSGAYTFRIVNILPFYRLVYLNDHTVWQINSKDSNFPNWQLGQSVMIGVNNEWRSNPYILINADSDQESYIEAKFYGYY